MISPKRSLSRTIGILAIVAATFGTVALTGCMGPRSVMPSTPTTSASQIQVPADLPKLPNYIPRPEGGGKQDFRQLINAESEGRGFDLGGVNLTFGYGTPLVSPGRGTVASVDNHPNDGNRIAIDLGVANMYLYHVKEVYVREGQIVSRRDVVATEGRHRRFSHTHVTPSGNVFLSDYSYGHRYSDYDYVDDQGTPRVALLAHLNNIIDPDKYAQGKLFMLNWWDGVSDPDAAYWKTVDEIKAALAAFIETYRGKEPADAVTRVKSPLFTDRINAFGEALADYEKRTGVDALVTDARKIVAKIKLAGTQLVFTSPFIKPGMEDQYIAWNPQHRVLIDAYRR